METGSKTAPAEPPATEFFDLHYANEPASYYYLVLQVGTTSVRACWYHQSKNLVTGYATYALSEGQPVESLKALLKEKAFLKAEFREVLALVNNHSFCLVPNLLREYDPRELLSLSHDVDESHDLLGERLINMKALAVYAIDPELRTVLEDTWSKCKVLPVQLPLIEEEINQLKRLEQKSRVVAHVQEEHVDILAFSEERLVLCNTYFQSGKEDIAYYLLYAAEILDIDPEASPLMLCGHIAIGDPCWQLLSNYWKTMEVVKTLPHLKLSEATRKAPESSYAFLTHALLCAS